MNYLEETEQWVTKLLNALMVGEVSGAEAVEEIVERVKQSWKNGIKAGRAIREKKAADEPGKGKEA